MSEASQPKPHRGWVLDLYCDFVNTVWGGECWAAIQMNTDVILKKKQVTRGFIKFLRRRSVGFFSWAFLVFLMKESKKRRRKQPGKLMPKSRSQPVNLNGAQPLMNPLSL